jgi:hypothetical protein
MKVSSRTNEAIHRKIMQGTLKELIGDELKTVFPVVAVSDQFLE